MVGDMVQVPGTWCGLGVTPLVAQSPVGSPGMPGQWVAPCLYRRPGSHARADRRPGALVASPDLPHARAARRRGPTHATCLSPLPEVRPDPLVLVVVLGVPCLPSGPRPCHRRPQTSPVPRRAFVTGVVPGPGVPMPPRAFPRARRSQPRPDRTRRRTLSRSGRRSPHASHRWGERQALPAEMRDPVASVTHLLSGASAPRSCLPRPLRDRFGGASEISPPWKSWRRLLLATLATRPSSPMMPWAACPSTRPPGSLPASAPPRCTRGHRCCRDAAWDAPRVALTEPVRRRLRGRLPRLVPGPRLRGVPVPRALIGR